MTYRYDDPPTMTTDVTVTIKVIGDVLTPDEAREYAAQSKETP